MLSSLHIENVAVIKQLDADFADGFTVLTGETGAGKSILIDSIAFLLGAKAQRELIRTGETKATVSGFFTDVSSETAEYLRDYGIELEDGTLTILKTLSQDGKVGVKINGRTVSATVGRNCGMSLINIHGQHDNQVLQNPSNHIKYLDRFAQNDALLATYASAYRQFRETRTELERLSENERDKERRRELLTYQIHDIEAAALTEGEEEALLARKKMLQNAKALSKHVLTAYRALYKNNKGASASQLVEFSLDSVNRLAEIFPDAEKLYDRLSDIQSEIETIAKAISAYMPSSSDDPERELEDIADRLDTIRKLKRKYGANESEILAFLARSRAELDELDSSDEKIKTLKALYLEEKQALVGLASELHKQRVQKGKELSRGICEVLAYLDMAKVSFSVSVKRREGDDEGLLANGYDEVEFYIATNIGEPMKPLTKVASGGELSRIMLAIKCVLAGAEAVPSIIFDEVDTGVSGKTSQKIGIKLSELSRSAQVICITHSAQIASVADHHFKIVKTERDNRVQTTLIDLDTEGRVSEIARIIGGVNITEKTRETAREMLEISR